jgi:uncharacterized membrane protein YkvI
LGRALPAWARPVIAIALIAGALLLSRWGIIDLIAVGYGAMTWVFIGILVIPLLTVGVWKVFARRQTALPAAASAGDGP